MITKNIKYICDEYEQIENYEKAIADKENVWICHHRLELDGNGHRLNTMKELKAKGMYYHRPPEELIFLSYRDHFDLHMNEEHKKRLAKFQKDSWKNTDRLDVVKAKAKNRRDEGKNLVNIEQLSSREAYRDYQRLQHRSWYNRNREQWNEYSYRKNLNNRSISELERLINRHQNSIELNKDLGRNSRIENLKRYIEIIEEILCSKLEELNRNINEKAHEIDEKVHTNA